MKNQNLKRTLRFTLILFVGLLASLAIHLFLINKAKENQKVFAMGRIDFKAQTAQENLTGIREYTASINGISNAIYNSQERVLVFIYEPKIVDAEMVLNKVKNHSKALATRYISSETELKSGCPVDLNKFSFIGKALSFLSSN